MNTFEKVQGINKGRVVLYALSTCMWCKKTKELLNTLGVEYDYLFMDQLDSEVEDLYNKELEKWNPRCSFPTLVINEDCVVGYDEEKIRKALA